MADAGHSKLNPQEKIRLHSTAWRVFRYGMITGVVGLVAAVVVAKYLSGEEGLRRFYFAYITSYAFFLSLSLGGLFFVLINHLTRAGWSVVVRRPAEVLAANVWILAVLAAPIGLALLTTGGEVYPWADPIYAEAAHGARHAQTAADPGLIVTVADNAPPHGVAGDSRSGVVDHHVLGKRAYLNKPFFIARWVIYFAAWSLMGVWYWRQSTLQDRTGDPAHTRRMEAFAAPALVVFAMTLTFASFDLIMTLEPTWYSTMFGVYYFGGAVIGALALLIIKLRILQRYAYLRTSVTVEHYHDLGKLLFGFVFFWGYIAFSQYMLIWYANIPTEMPWLVKHGMTTVPEDVNAWSYVVILLLFGQFVIPFVGLMSRHAKRNVRVLTFWAIWLLVFHWVDLYWLVMPSFATPRTWPPFGAIEVGCLLGIGGIYIISGTKLATYHSLIPTQDPRLAESLAFENL